MGSPPEEAGRHDDEMQHSVTLTKGFYLGIHPVTQAQWRAVMGDNPSRYCGEILPVEGVSRGDCRKFCENLSRMDKKRYRLPTEAEWEYACRAGTTTSFHFGETIDPYQANYNDSYYSYGKNKTGVHRQRTTPVGNFPPNGWGLFDMHGNVWERCSDWYGAKYYKQSPRQNPQGPKRGGLFRVFRGGSEEVRSMNCRAACRGRDMPGYKYVVGFRVVVVSGAT